MTTVNFLCLCVFLSDTLRHRQQSAFFLPRLDLLKEFEILHYINNRQRLYFAGYWVNLPGHAANIGKLNDTIFAARLQ